jgi:hypothetical protein
MMQGSSNALNNCDSDLTNNCYNLMYLIGTWKKRLDHVLRTLRHLNIHLLKELQE